MFKKSVAVVSIVVLLLSTLVATGAFAQSEGNTSTSVLVQNLSTSNANILVDFYNTSGTNTGSKSVSNLCGECTTTFDQRYSSGDPGEDPFQGSAIVSADQPIGAIVQEMRSGGSAGVNSYDAYNGIGTLAQDTTAPLILKGINSAGKTWNTFIAIQNPSDTTTANVDVVFTPAGVGTGDTESSTIAPGGTWYLRQADQTGIGSTFFGSALVDSDIDVAVIVNSATTDGSALIVYPTYTAGAETVYLPGAMKNIASMGDNYFTSATIVNLGTTSPVTVTVEYQALSGTVGAAYDVSVDKVLTIDQRYDGTISSGSFFGAITVSTDPGNQIAAMLNTRGDDAVTGDASFASTYSGFTSGVSTVFVPYLLKLIPSAGYNWSTSILIQNLDPAGGALPVNITYNEDPGFGTDSFNSSVTVTSFDFVDLRYDTNLTEGTFYGGAKLNAPSGRPFNVAVLVRGSDGSGDALSSYLGIPAPSP